MDEESAQENVSPSLPHRMVYFFYERQAIGRDAWDVAFWSQFRRRHPDVSMDAKSIRSFFFTEIMRNPTELDGLPYAVVQYVNPFFNQLREEVLEFRDLVEGIDYVYDQLTVPTAEASSILLPPLMLQVCPTARAVPITSSTKRFIIPTAEQIQDYVADELSELLRTQDERHSQTSLSLEECLLRLALLTKERIPLMDCIEPGMKCYERFQRSRMIDCPDETLLEEQTPNSTNEASGQFHFPNAASTPMSRSRSEQWDQSNTMRDYSGPQQMREYGASSSYRSLDYSSILRHVRSKPRKGLLKK